MTSLAELIGKAESNNDYNVYNRGTLGGKILGAKFKRSLVTSRINAILSDMALPPENTNHLFAVGRYQLIPTTLKDAVAKLHIDVKNAVFSEEMQDTIFTEYLLKIKRTAIFNYITGESNDIHAACLALACEWASFADPNTGNSHYGSGNHASVSVAQMTDALNRARSAHTEQGMNFMQAVLHG